MKKIYSVLIMILIITISFPLTVNAQESAKETLTKKVVSSGSGLYKDEYENGRYIFKGETPNNYLTFNNENAGWRILSVEKDGTIKIIKNHNIGSITFDSKQNRGNGEESKAGTYCKRAYLGSYSGCNFWAPNTDLINTPETIYNGRREGTVIGYSTAATLLNSEYYDSLTLEAKKYITENIFYIGPTTEMNLSNEITKNKLKENIESEQAYQWNGKVGLATFTEYVRAQDWIFNKEPALTITPEYDSTAAIKVANAKNSYGEIKNEWTTAYTEGENYEKDSLKAFPVLYLTSSIELRGAGTQEDPYTIAEPVRVNFKTFGDLEKTLFYKFETAGKTTKEIRKEIQMRIGTEIEQDGKACTLDSWYLDRELKTKFDETTPINNNLNLYGRWECRQVETVDVPNTLLQIPPIVINIGCGLTILGIGIILFIIKKKYKSNGG